MRVSSSLYDKAGGSIQKITAGANAGGNSFRKKPVAHYIASENQELIRRLVKEANEAWHSLSEAVRVQWMHYGQSCESVNSTGAKLRLTGCSAFMRSYIILTQANVSTSKMFKNAPILLGYYPNPWLEIREYFDVTNELLVINKSEVALDILVYSGKKTAMTVNSYRNGFNYTHKGHITAGGTRVIPDHVVAGRNWYKFHAYMDDGRVTTGQTLLLDADS